MAPRGEAGRRDEELGEQALERGHGERGMREKASEEEARGILFVALEDGERARGSAKTG